MARPTVPWIAATIALALAAGCDQLAPQKLAEPPEAAAAAGDPALRAHVGTAYEDFVAAEGMARYSPDELPISDAAKARLRHAMGQGAPSWAQEGGGTEALIFVGCAQGACAQAAGIVAIDMASGAVFAAVRDADGREVLATNERLEALIEATEPADRWHDPSAWGEEPAPPPP